jgi:hypothetical protein
MYTGDSPATFLDCTEQANSYWGLTTPWQFKFCFSEGNCTDLLGIDQAFHQAPKSAPPLEQNTTIAHAEVNLHAHILRLQRTLRTQSQEAPVFFNNSKYIGCSNPTCRLCELWFGNHPSRVRVRDGHRGLYAQWRAPDVHVWIPTAMLSFGCEKPRQIA